MNTSASFSFPGGAAGDGLTLIDDLLGEQRTLTAVERFALSHGRHERPALEKHYRKLLPATPPGPGQQYAFEVDLDKCSGCKACVSACHSLNGLDETETWRSVGLLVSSPSDSAKSRVGTQPTTRTDHSALRVPHSAFQQHITTACHHCEDPGCLNGCPVLAYDKDPVTGIVRHLDDQCIGCSYCIMKCPYEVPKYSARLGIVRKCDMCASRLAVGEAPACVQACPDEAIKITLVAKGRVEELKGSSVEASELTTLQPFNSSTHSMVCPGVAQVSQPAVSPMSQSAGGGNSWAFRIIGRPAGLETRDTADLEVCATVEQGNAQTTARAVPPAWLPDSPDPRLTRPTTRYVSARGLPKDAVAADSEALRLDPAHWPLVVMLVLTQAAAGIFLVGAVLALGGGVSLKPVGIVGFGLLVIGLNAAVFHLGQPLKAWRAFLGWRTSWLSREIILFNVFAAAATAALGALWVPQLAGLAPLLMAAAAVAGAVGVFSSAMVYVDTGRRLWSRRIVFGNFFGSALVLGAAITPATLGGHGGPVRGMLVAAVLLHAGLFLWRQLELRAALGNRESRAHFAARVIRNLLPRVQSARTVLFVLSVVFAVMALADVAGRAALWAVLAAVAVLGAELVGRYVFFVAGAGKRMPGGVIA